MPRPTEPGDRDDPQTPTQTSWREHDDRDAHQDRLATELAADSSTDW
jgi:hypothetical protein